MTLLKLLDVCVYRHELPLVCVATPYAIIVPQNCGPVENQGHWSHRLVHESYGVGLRVMKG